MHKLLSILKNIQNSPTSEPWHDPEQSHKDLLAELAIEEYLHRKFLQGPPQQQQQPLMKSDNTLKDTMARQVIEDTVQNKVGDSDLTSGYKQPTGKSSKPNYKILTNMESNAKTAKNAHVGGYVSGILHLAPASLAGVGNVCAAASEGCRDSCLNTAGRGGMFTEGSDIGTIQSARVRKTQQLVQDPHSFFKNLMDDIHKTVNAAKVNGSIPVIRLNGTSDIAWEKFKHMGGKNIFEHFPDVQFYDYTKRPDRVLKNNHPNYHLTFSRSEVNENVAKRVLSHGHNVAAVFGGKQLPSEWNGHEVISGDDHDLRFLDERGGKVVGLLAKGEAKSDNSGFVIWNHAGNPEGLGPKQRVRNKAQEVATQVAAANAKQDPLKKSVSSPKLTPPQANSDQTTKTPKIDYREFQPRSLKDKIEQDQRANKLDYSMMKTPDSAPQWKTKLSKTLALFKRK